MKKIASLPLGNMELNGTQFYARKVLEVLMNKSFQPRILQNV